MNTDNQLFFFRLKKHFAYHKNNELKITTGALTDICGS